MKLEKIIRSEFNAALNELADKPISIPVSYKVADLLEKVKKERTTFESVRQKLLSKHAEKDENGQMKTNKDRTEYVLKDREAFQKEYSELLSLEIDLPKLNLQELGDVKIAPKVLAEIHDLLIP